MYIHNICNILWTRVYTENMQYIVDTCIYITYAIYCGHVYIQKICNIVLTRVYTENMKYNVDTCIYKNMKYKVHTCIYKKYEKYC